MLLEKRIPVTYILNKIKYNLINVMLVSVVVLVITDYCGKQLPDMPLTIPAFIGTAISILLSFKLSQSYDRWWEARKVWGSIVNDSRSFIIQLSSLPKNPDPLLVKKIAYRHIAWCYSLGRSLRGLDPLEGLESYITPDDLNNIRKHHNIPLAMLHLHAQDIKQLKDANQLDSFSHIQIDNTLVRFSESQGKAERIKSTVFPVTYRKFLHFIIYLFVITLSVSLNVTGAFEIPLLLLISSAFFLLEKSATHMQDPFENRPTDTAVTTIGSTIEVNIKQMLNESAEKPAPSSTFYAL